MSRQPPPIEALIAASTAATLPRAAAEVDVEHATFFGLYRSRPIRSRPMPLQARPAWASAALVQTTKSPQGGRIGCCQRVVGQNHKKEGPEGWVELWPLFKAMDLSNCAFGLLWGHFVRAPAACRPPEFHTLTPGSPHAHFGWTSALNRGHNSTRRPSNRGKKGFGGGKGEKT